MMRFDGYQDIARCGGNGLGASVFMWFAYVLVVIVLVLSAFALWKYISKK